MYNLTEEQKNKATGFGIICWILFFIFLTLKLMGSITWSWWWVTCPLWIPTAFPLLLAIVISVLLIIFGFVSAIFESI